jgi:hypothetical protein
MESTLMKRLWIIAILAASASACVEGNNAVQLLNAAPPDPSACTPAAVSLLSGKLNFNAGSSYGITFGLFSPIELQGDSTQSPAAFYAEELIYNYESKNPKVTFTEERLPIYFVVNVGADPDESYLLLDLIGAEARKKLESAVPTAPDFMTLLATVKVKGKLPSGKTVETNEVTFPIEITRARACAAGTVPVTDSATPCAYPGQDAYFNNFTCSPAGG